MFCEVPNLWNAFHSQRNKLLCATNDERLTSAFHIHYISISAVRLNRILRIRVFRQTCIVHFHLNKTQYTVPYEWRNALQRNAKFIAHSMCTSSENAKWNIFRERCRQNLVCVRDKRSFNDRGQKAESSNAKNEMHSLAKWHPSINRTDTRTIWMRPIISISFNLCSQLDQLFSEFSIVAWRDYLPNQNWLTPNWSIVEIDPINPHWSSHKTLLARHPLCICY